MEMRFSLPELHALVHGMFEHCGVPAQDACTAAQAICYADAYGITTHGVNALVNLFVPRLRSGQIAATATATVVSESKAVAVLDGQQALGLVTATVATDLVGDKAQDVGIGAVAVRNSTHFGAAGYYARRLAERGLIGLVMTNCGEQGVAPPLGGRLPMLGTNPIAAAVPGHNVEPFVLDMSTTATAKAKILAAVRAGQQVPAGWLIDDNGQSITDPARYVEGAAHLAWLGGAKGYGLAVLVDLLCGPLAGSAFGPRPELLDGARPGEHIRVGHFLLAVNPAVFGDPALIAAGTDSLLDTLANSPPAGYTTAVSYPGKAGAEIARQSRMGGVILPSALIEALSRQLQLLGMPGETPLSVARALQDSCLAGSPGYDCG